MCFPSKLIKNLRISLISRLGRGVCLFPFNPCIGGGTKSFQLREKTAAIDRSRGVRFRSAQELCLTPSRRKVLDVWKSRIFRIWGEIEISREHMTIISDLGTQLRAASKVFLKLPPLYERLSIRAFPLAGMNPFDILKKKFYKKCGRKSNGNFLKIEKIYFPLILRPNA